MELKRLFGCLSLLLTLSCHSLAAEINYNNLPEKDWPQLKITIEHGSPEAISRLCEERGGGKKAIACAQVDFITRTCTIYMPKTHPMYDYILFHEKSHCAGFDHYGSNVLHQAWREYKQSIRRF